MKNEWIRISPADAKIHKFYGIGGWLWLFSVALILGLMANLGAIRGAAFESGLTLSEFLDIDEPIISFFKFSAAAHFSSAVIIFWMMISKAPAFRKVVTGLLTGVTPLVLFVGIINPFVGFGQIAAQSLVPWLLSCAVWCTYFHRSRRVRVTFENLVPKSDLQEATSSSSNSAEKPANHVCLPLEIIDSKHPTQKIQIPPENASAKAIDEQFWAEALKELNGAERRDGLWARSFAQAKGNETQAKVTYLEVRALELAKAHETQLVEQERVKQLQEQEERLAALTEEERAYELLPKGFCPNCKAVQPLDSEECPSCKAAFGSFSAWKLIPLPSDHLENSHHDNTRNFT